MARNAKLNELVNTRLVAKYKSGFETWKTSYQKSAELGFRIGKLVDRKKDVRDEGNFVTALITKGVRAADRVFEPTVYDHANYSNYFDWKFEDPVTGEEIYTTLTWLQNQNLQNKLTVEVPAEGVIVIPKIAEKTVDFEVTANVESDPASPEEPVPLPEEEKVKIDDLPF